MHGPTGELSAVVATPAPRDRPFPMRLPWLVGAEQWQCAYLLGLASHTFTVLSALALARRLPSPLNATLLTMCVCPLSERISWPLAASHSFTVPPAAALARRLPSLLNATQVTVSLCPLREKTSWPIATSHTFTVWSALRL